MKSHLETLSNTKALSFMQTGVSFDLQGRMSGVLHTADEQSLQLLCPRGAALRVEDARSLHCERGCTSPTHTCWAS
jgi:hypothetical protein